MEDARIVELYWQRDADAIAQTSAKYGGYCYAIAFRILDDRGDAEECVNDAWMGAWNAMPVHRPDRLGPFVGKLVRRAAVSRLQGRRAEKRGGGQLPLALEELADCVPSVPGADRAVEDLRGLSPVAGLLSAAPKSSAAYKTLTDEEVANYNYLRNTRGEAAANEYLDYIEEIVNQRFGEADAQRIRGTENPAARTALTAATAAHAGVEQFRTGIKQLFHEDALPVSPGQFTASAVREDLAGTGPKLPDALGGASLGQMAFDLTQTTANMAPSFLLSVLTGGGAGAAVLGTSAGGNAYGEARRQGYSPDQASNYAILVGASEGALQYALGGISALGGKLTGNVAQATIQNIDNALLRIAAELGVKMAGEGTEEYLQEILTPVFRNMTLGEDNEIKLVTPEAAYSFLMGALSAGMLEGGEVISRNASNAPARVVERRASSSIENTFATNEIAEGVSPQPRADISQRRGIERTPSASDLIIRRDAQSVNSESAQVGAETSKVAQTTASTGEAGIIPFTEQESINLSSRKGIVNGHGMTFKQFLNNVKSIGNSVRFYFGKVSATLGARIASAVGQDVSGYNIAIRSDEVVHSLSAHGNADYEAKRGQLQVTPETLERLPEIFSQPDEVELLPAKDYAGRTAFELRKWVDGYMVAVIGIANGKHSIEVDSVRIINKKGPPPTINATQNVSLDLTPETSRGQTLPSDPIIRRVAQGVNSEFVQAGPDSSVGAEVDRSVSDRYDETVQNEGSRLSETEQAALLEYKSSGSYKLNAALRDGGPLTSEQQAMAEHLDRALEKLPVYEGTVYRRLSFDMQGQEALEAFLAEHSVENAIRYKAYTSTSTRSEGHPVDGKLTVLLVLDSRSGRNMTGIGNNFEHEVLFPRGGRFTIERAELSTDGTPVIYMREVTENGIKRPDGQLYSEKRYGELPPVREVSQGDIYLPGVSGMDPGQSNGQRMSTLQTQGGVGAESLTQVSPDSSVGAAPAGFDPYSRMVNQYGAIPEGENPTRVVDVPTSTDGTDRVSRAARTAMEAAVTPDSAVEDIAQAVADASIPRGTKKGCGEAAFCFVQEIISKA